MSEQRTTNPLPVGRYWIDVADKASGANGVDDWDAWLGANAAKVKTETSEEHPPEGGNPRRLFTIFNVTSPVFFPAANFGFPNFAPDSVRTEADTANIPDVPDLKLPTFGDLAGAVPLILIVAVLLALSKGSSSSRATA